MMRQRKYAKKMSHYTLKEAEKAGVASLAGGTVWASATLTELATTALVLCLLHFFLEPNVPLLATASPFLEVRVPLPPPPSGFLEACSFPDPRAPLLPEVSVFLELLVPLFPVLFAGETLLG